MRVKCDRTVCVCACICMYMIGIKVLYETIFHGTLQVELCFPFSYPHFLRK